jgi:kynurenine formamidase
MNPKTFVIACVLVLAVFLFAQRHSHTAERPLISRVVDLSHTMGPGSPGFDRGEVLRARTVSDYAKDGYFARELTLPEHFATHVDAPAHFARGAWTADQIPAERLVRPVVVLEVAGRAERNSDYLVSLEDIAEWETQHGRIPAGAVVMAHTGWDRRWSSSEAFRNSDAQGVMHFPGYALETAEFLVTAREAVGLGIDTLSVDSGPAADFPVHRFTSAHGVYHIEGVANLEEVPPVGAVVVVALAKLQGGSGSPARVLALIP